jgi:hypothetical protein
MPNAWIEFVKQYAKKHDLTYGCAISKAGVEYRALKSGKKTEPVKKIEAPKQLEMIITKIKRPKPKMIAESDEDFLKREVADLKQRISKEKDPETLTMYKTALKSSVSKLDNLSKPVKKVETPKPVKIETPKPKVIKTPKIIQNAVISKKEKKAILAELTMNLNALKKQQSRMPSQSRSMDIADLEKRILEVGSL